MCFDPLSAMTALKAAVTGFTGLLGGGAAAGGAAAGGAWGALGTAATVAGGVVSAYSAVQNSKAAAAAANASAEQADHAALQALEAGEREELLHQRRVGALIGENRAALAASGVDVNSTAALDLLQDTNKQAAEDAFAIRENAQRQASGYGREAANYRTEAANAKSSGRWGAANTILGTVATVGSKYRHYVQQNRVQQRGGY